MVLSGERFVRGGCFSVIVLLFLFVVGCSPSQQTVKSKAEAADQITSDTSQVGKNSIPQKNVIKKPVLTNKQWQDKAAADKAAMLKTSTLEKYKFTPKLRSAYLTAAKSQARAALSKEKKNIPEEFFIWIDSDAIVEATVYGAHSKPADIILHLYALQMDLGKATFQKYHQLALAEAVVNAKQKIVADITPRGTVKLAIGGDPRKPVNTKDSNRKLDKNDHIINFLKDNKIKVDVVVGHKLPELKYDDRGIAIPMTKKEKKKKVPVMEKHIRSLYASDVIGSRDLQKKFNAYMKSKGHDVNIDCGDKIIHWKARDGVKGPMRAKIATAHNMFHDAYKAKGLMPKARDPFPTPGEQLTFFIRNYEYKFKEKRDAKLSWPKFPLTAPWPTLVMLTYYDQPLRECQERWEAFRDKGIYKTYGEYIGGVAQQFDMQSARRIKPYPFTYGTIQMMLKDGGVCGTMGNISVRSHTSLGIPATTAGQPGHCAMVAFRYDKKTKTYGCKGGQYATGGDDKTSPHSGWFFGKYKTTSKTRKGKTSKRPARKMMIYHQTVAWAVNYGMPQYLDSLMAYSVFDKLPETDRKANGMTLLKSGLKINPYSFALVDAMQALATTPQQQIECWNSYKSIIASAKKKPGCPVAGLYEKTVKKNMFAKVAKLPIPSNKAQVSEVSEALKCESCDNPETLARYLVALEGLPALLSRTETQFKNHLQVVNKAPSKTNDLKAAQITATIKATSALIKNNKERRQWAAKLYKLSKGKEKYFANKYKIVTVPAVATLAKMSRQKLPADKQLIQQVLDSITAELKKSVAAKRDLKKCKKLSVNIAGAAKSLKDVTQKKAWIKQLSSTIKGKEKFKYKQGKRTKTVTDPCVTVINKLR